MKTRLLRALTGVATIVASACSSGASARALPPGATPVAGGCGTTALYRGASPGWTKDARAPSDLVQATGRRGQVAAFIFGFPLRAGHPQNPDNKILWVVRQPRDGSDLLISAHRLGHAGPTVGLRQPADSGPGEIYPSIVDVTDPGCWHLTLDWHGHGDTIDLAFGP